MLTNPPPSQRALSLLSLFHPENHPAKFAYPSSLHHHPGVLLSTSDTYGDGWQGSVGGNSSSVTIGSSNGLSMCTDFVQGTEWLVSLFVYPEQSQLYASTDVLPAVLIPTPPKLTFGSELTATLTESSVCSGITLFWLCWRSGTSDQLDNVVASCEPPGDSKVFISALTSGAKTVCSAQGTAICTAGQVSFASPGFTASWIDETQLSVAVVGCFMNPNAGRRRLVEEGNGHPTRRRLLNVTSAPTSAPVAATAAPVAATAAPTTAAPVADVPTPQPTTSTAPYLVLSLSTAVSLELIVTHAVVPAEVFGTHDLLTAATLPLRSPLNHLCWVLNMWYQTKAATCFAAASSAPNSSNVVPPILVKSQSSTSTNFGIECGAPGSNVIKLGNFKKTHVAVIECSGLTPIGVSTTTTLTLISNCSAGSFAEFVPPGKLNPYVSYTVRWLLIVSYFLSDVRAHTRTHTRARARIYRASPPPTFVSFPLSHNTTAQAAS